MRRFKAEAGFSLTELLVVVAVLGIVLTAVLGILQVTQRATLFASAGEDAQVTARAALNQLATDQRLINRGRPTSPGAIIAASATSITFLSDIDNDTQDAAGNDATLTAPANIGATTVLVSSATGFSVGELLSIADGPIAETQPITAIAGTALTLGAGLTASYPVGSIVRSVETVTYAWDPATRALCRNVGGPCVAPFPNNLVIATNITGFQLTYFNSAGAVIPNPTTQAARDAIREVRIQLTSLAQSGDQTVSRIMAVTVRPRNFFN